ncbi:MAG: DUF4389 domain-containing protein [Gammaproteobacteria bacterium]|nr:DUF4389 domain-containing protein [Gammaproteobacteria bacterium]
MTTSDRPMDHVPPSADTGGRSEQSDLEKNVKARSTWLRLFFMIIFALLYGLSRVVTAAVVVIQFFHVLFTGDTNENLKTFGHSLAIYSYEVVEYLTFNTETKPFPLEAVWPDELPVPESMEETGAD